MMRSSGANSLLPEKVAQIYRQKFRKRSLTREGKNCYLHSGVPEVNLLDFFKKPAVSGFKALIMIINHEHRRNYEEINCTSVRGFSYHKTLIFHAA